VRSAPKAAEIKAKPTTNKRGISAAARKRMFEAAKERWTAKKKPAKAVSATEVFSKKAATKIAKKRVLSPEIRKKMAEAQQKRWAAKKKAEKSS
jgi:hypothetical protein